jgi:hypothetical protein
MRPTGNSDRDSLIKRDFYDGFIKNRYNVHFVVDDRPQVIRELWMDLGVPLFNVGPYYDF